MLIFFAHYKITHIFYEFIIRFCCSLVKSCCFRVSNFGRQLIIIRANVRCQRSPTVSYCSVIIHLLGPPNAIQSDFKVGVLTDAVHVFFLLTTLRYWTYDILNEITMKCVQMDSKRAFVTSASLQWRWHMAAYIWRGIHSFL